MTDDRFHKIISMKLNSIIIFLILITLSNFIFPEISNAYKLWGFSSNEEGWTGRNGTYAVQSSDNGGQLTVNTVGSDPGIVSPNISLSAPSNNLLRMRVATFCSDRNATIYFKRFGSSTVYTGGTTYYSSGGNWGTYEVNMSGNSNWTGTITQIRIDPAGSCGSSTSPGFIAFDWIEITQIPTLSPPYLISPKNNVTVNSIQLQWQTVSGASGYQLDVDGNTVDINNGSQTTYSPTLGYGSYQWRARTENSGGAYGSWSGYAYFNYQPAALSPPNLVAPNLTL